MSSAQEPHRDGDTTLEFEARSDGHSPRVRVSFGARSDCGKVRENNEDHFLVARLCKSMQVCKSSLPDDGTNRFSDEEGYLMVVADGMGGAAAGERASALAVGSLEAFILNTFKWFLHMGGREQSILFEQLRQGLKRADHSVVARAQADPYLHGMGTTLTMAYSERSRHDNRMLLPVARAGLPRLRSKSCGPSAGPRCDCSGSMYRAPRGAAGEKPCP